MAPYDRFQTIGWNIKAIGALIVVFLIWLYLPLGVIGFIGFLYLCLLLHTPLRQLPASLPQNNDIITAPIDGRITHLDCGDDHIIIDILCHLTSSQIVFAPLSGVIEDKLWIDGAYMNADTPHFEMLSARQEWVISHADGQQVTLIQFASPQTRYLTSALTTGQQVVMGEAFALGLMRSHIRLIVPSHYQLEVYEGQSCLAGESVLARDGRANSS